MWIIETFPLWSQASLIWLSLCKLLSIRIGLFHVVYFRSIRITIKASAGPWSIWKCWEKPSCCVLLFFDVKRHRECAHLLFSQIESTLSLCGFVPNPQKLVSLVLSLGFERLGTASLPNKANNYTLVWTKRGTKSFWKIHQPSPQHLRQHQALGKSYRRKRWLGWRGDFQLPQWARGLGGGQQRSELLLVCLRAGRQGWQNPAARFDWPWPATNVGLPEAICNWNICFVSTLVELQKGRGLGKETLKM